MNSWGQMFIKVNISNYGRPSKADLESYLTSEKRSKLADSLRIAADWMEERF